MGDYITLALAYLRQRWHDLRDDDEGATAIEWAVFAFLAITIAGIVAGAITLYVKSESAKIK